MEHHDELARMRAEMDQAREGLKEVAGSLWAFYNELTDQGFTPTQAISLTGTFLSCSFGQPSSGDGE